MKKKLLLLLLTALLCVLSAFLIACGDDPPPEEPHAHVFGEWNATTPATCVAEGVMTRSCACGHAETQPIAATGVHTYGVDNACTACGQRLSYTEGLSFELIDNGASYAVVHIGSAVAEQVILPAYHEGKPVTALRGLLVQGDAVSTHRITALEISATVTSVDPKALVGCTDLVSLQVAPGNVVYRSSGNCIIQTAEKLLVAGCKTSIIPTNGSVNAIGSYAFYCNTALTDVTVPYAVTVIAPEAFAGCEQLATVTLENAQASAEPKEPNPLLDGWYVSKNVGATTGTSVETIEPAMVAALLKGEYSTYYWYRQASDDSVRY